MSELAPEKLDLTVQKILEQFDLYNKNHSKFYVALSGGIDSVALLLLLANQLGAVSIAAIHVNHGLSSQAQDWEAFCRELCVSLGVQFLSETVAVGAKERQKQGLEAAARHARYSVFAGSLPEKALLFTGHHQDDQLETILLRLERGVDVLGLPGIRSQQTMKVDGRQLMLIRPLLEISKANLRSYLEARGQSWVEDDSNADKSLRRNYLRQEVVPSLPVDLRQQLLNMAGLASQAEPKLKKMLVAAGAELGANEFELSETLMAHQELARLALKYWLRERSIGLPKTRLEEALRQLRQGSGLGRNPFYSNNDYAIYIRRNRLFVER